MELPPSSSNGFRETPERLPAAMREAGESEPTPTPDQLIEDIHPNAPPAERLGAGNVPKPERPALPDSDEVPAELDVTRSTPTKIGDVPPDLAGQVHIQSMNKGDSLPVRPASDEVTTPLGSNDPPVVDEGKDSPRTGDTEADRGQHPEAAATRPTRANTPEVLGAAALDLTSQVPGHQPVTASTGTTPTPPPGPREARDTEPRTTTPTTIATGTEPAEAEQRKSTDTSPTPEAAALDRASGEVGAAKEGGDGITPVNDVQTEVSTAGDVTEGVAAGDDSPEAGTTAHGGDTRAVSKRRRAMRRAADKRATPASAKNRDTRDVALPPHGGDSGEYPSIPLANRTKYDIVARPGETFLRGEIDRSIDEADLMFGSLTPGTPGELREAEYHVENSPSYRATEIAKATGHVGIGLIGAGTGNGLMTWGHKIAKNTPCKLRDVTMTGISRQDYSGESANRDAYHNAYRGPQPLIRYIVGDAEHMPEIEDGSQDVTLAHNSMPYSKRPDIWLTEMIRITRPGGTIFFNTTVEQVLREQLPELLLRLEAEGWPLLRSTALLRPPPGRPGMKATTIFRLDIPQ